MSLNALRALKMRNQQKIAEKGPTTVSRIHIAEGGGGSAWWKPDAHNMPPQQHKRSVKLLTSVSTGTNRSSTRSFQVNRKVSPACPYHAIWPASGARKQVLIRPSIEQK